MRKNLFLFASALIFTFSFTSCREKKEMTPAEAAVEEMQNDGADIEVKDGGDKIKMDNGDKEIKIKTDDDGNTKIKTDDNS